MTTTISVDSAQALANAILQINANPSGSYVIQFQYNPGDSHDISLTHDLPILNAGSARVTIDGGSTSTTLDGGNTYRGLFVQSGNVTLQNITILDTAAVGGDGGTGIGGGGGGAGLGGGLYVGSAATVTLNNVDFSGDSAVGGHGGGINGIATSGGGGGGMGGAGAAGGTQNLFAGYLSGTTFGGGGGGGGLGLSAYGSGNPSFWGFGGQGDAAGEAGGGGGGSRDQFYEDTYFWGAYTSTGTDTTGGTGGGSQGGGGGFGVDPNTGGGGGGIGGTTPVSYNDNSTEVRDQTSTFEEIAGYALIAAQVALAIIAPPAALGLDIVLFGKDFLNDLGDIESGSFSLEQGIQLGIEGITIVLDAKGLAGVSDVADAAFKEGEQVSSDLGLQNLKSDLKTTMDSLSRGSLYQPKIIAGQLLQAFATSIKNEGEQQLIGLAENLARNLYQGDGFKTSLQEAAANIDPYGVEGDIAYWTGAVQALTGQSSSVTLVSNTDFATARPTAGGTGGFGGGGGGGAGVGGAGGYGGGGGGAGLPSTTEDFVGGAGGFGGGGGGASVNGTGGQGGFGAGDGTNGYYYDPNTGTYAPSPAMGGGGLGAGGGVFVQAGGKLIIGGNVRFSGDVAQGGLAYNSGMGLGADIFVSGGGLLTVSPGTGQTDSLGNLTDQNASEAGYTADKVGLQILGTGLVQLNGTNTYSGPTIVGDPGVADGAKAVNGRLEITAGTVVRSNIVLEAGSTLIVDAGAEVLGSIDASAALPGQPITLQIDPTATVTGGIIQQTSHLASGSTTADVQAILQGFASQSGGAAQPFVVGINVASTGQTLGGTVTLPKLAGSAPLTIRAEPGGGTLAAGSLVLPDPTGTSLQTGLTLATMSAGDTLTVQSNISDANPTASAAAGYRDLTVAGPGTVVLTGNANTFRGGVSLAGGTLDVTGPQLSNTITFATTATQSSPLVLSTSLTLYADSYHLAWIATEQGSTFPVPSQDFGALGFYDLNEIGNDPALSYTPTLIGANPYGIPTDSYVFGPVHVYSIQLNQGFPGHPPDYATYYGDYVTPSVAIATPLTFDVTPAEYLSFDISVHVTPLEVRGFAGGTLTSGDRIELTNITAPAQAQVQTSFSHNGETWVAVSNPGGTEGFIDFGQSVAAYSQFTLRAGEDGVATLTLDQSTFDVASGTDLVNAASTISGSGATASININANIDATNAAGYGFTLGSSQQVEIAGYGHTVALDGGFLNLSGGTTRVEDLTLTQTQTASLNYFFPVYFGAGTTATFEHVSLLAVRMLVYQGATLDLRDSIKTGTAPSEGADDADRQLEVLGTVTAENSQLVGDVDVGVQDFVNYSGTVVLGDGSLAQGTINLFGPGSQLVADPSVGAQTLIQSAISGVGSFTVGSAAQASQDVILSSGAPPDGGTTLVTGNNSFTGGTTILSGTLDLSGGAGLGTGTVVLSAGAVLQIDGTTLPTNTIDFSSGGGLIRLTALPVSVAQQAAVNASGNLRFISGGVTETLDISGVATGTVFDIAADGANTDIALASQTAHVGTSAGLIAAASLSAVAGTPTVGTVQLSRNEGTLTLAGSHTLSLPIGDAPGAGTATSLAVGDGGSLTLGAVSSFAGGISIGNGSTLSLKAPGAGGSGAVTFAGQNGKLVIAAGSTNPILGFSAGDSIHLTGATGVFGTATVDASHAVTFGTGTVQLANAPAGMAVTATSDGAGGLILTTADKLLDFTVATEANLDSALAAIKAAAASSPVAALITFAAGADIKLTKALPTLTLSAGSAVEINGNGATLDGQEQVGGLAVNGAGALRIEALTLSGLNAAGTGALQVGGTVAATLSGVTLIEAGAPSAAAVRSRSRPARAWRPRTCRRCSAAHSFPWRQAAASSAWEQASRLMSRVKAWAASRSTPAAR
jgi:autotransporter-associated beta strand protein